MLRPRKQLDFSLVWADADMQELVIGASSEHFAGVTSLYVFPGELSELAASLRGFPESTKDERTLTLGQTNLPSYGHVQVTFSCRDSTGHIGVHIQIQCVPSEPTDRPESCAVLLQVVPSDIDRFVTELQKLNEEGQTATLRNEA